MSGLCYFLALVDKVCPSKGLTKLDNTLTRGNKSLEPLGLLLNIGQVLVASFRDQKIVLDSTEVSY